MERSIGESVLVTGASGFIGRHLVCRLIARGCRVTCLVRATSRIDDLQSIGAERVVGDITDRAGLERLIAACHPDVVFHLAGQLRALRPDDFMPVNSGGCQSIAAACAGLPAPPIVVVVSSLAAAGPCAIDRPREEEDAPSPVSAYGRSKLAGEQAVARCAESVPVSIVRPAMVFGPGDRAILEMFQPIARWGLHAVPGSGRQRFSLLYVEDLVEGLLLTARKGERIQPGGTPGQGVYFMAGLETPSYTELGQAIAAALGRKRAAILPVPAALLHAVGLCNDMMARLRRQPGWLNGDKIAEALAGSWMCSSAKARTQLGWSPAAPLAGRLCETAQWYRQAGWL